MILKVNTQEVRRVAAHEARWTMGLLVVVSIALVVFVGIIYGSNLVRSSVTMLSIENLTKEFRTHLVWISALLAATTIFTYLCFAAARVLHAMSAVRKDAGLLDPIILANVAVVLAAFEIMFGYFALTTAVEHAFAILGSAQQDTEEGSRAIIKLYGIIFVDGLGLHALMLILFLTECISVSVYVRDAVSVVRLLWWQWRGNLSSGGGRRRFRRARFRPREIRCVLHQPSPGMGKVDGFAKDMCASGTGLLRQSPTHNFEALPLVGYLEMEPPLSVLARLSPQEKDELLSFPVEIRHDSTHVPIGENVPVLVTGLRCARGSVGRQRSQVRISRLQHLGVLGVLDD